MCRYPPGLIRNRGMTAVELLFTMAIAALVMALAVPNFRDFVQNNRAAEEANALVGALALARSEAVTRGVPVTVCSSDRQRDLRRRQRYRLEHRLDRLHRRRCHWRGERR